MQSTRVSGWFEVGQVSGEPIERVEVYIDGTYRFDVPHGDKRNELVKRFPRMSRQVNRVSRARLTGTS